MAQVPLAVRHRSSQRNPSIYSEPGEHLLRLTKIIQKHKEWSSTKIYRDGQTLTSLFDPDQLLVGYTYFQGHMHTDEDENIPLSIDGERLQKAIQQANVDRTDYTEDEPAGVIVRDHAFRKPYELIRDLFTAGTSLYELTRLITSEQAPLYTFTPDIRNTQIIESDSATTTQNKKTLGLELLFQKIWIRYLHLRGLWHMKNTTQESITDYEPGEAFGNLYICARLLLQAERECTFTEFDHGKMGEFNPTTTQEDPDANKLQFLVADTKVIQKIFNTLALIAHEPLSRIRNPGPPTVSQEQREENFAQNTTGSNAYGMMGALVTEYAGLMNLHPRTRLIIDLLIKENRFEENLAFEHVEDKLINKQIVLYDEHSLDSEELPWGAAEFTAVEDRDVNTQNGVYQTLRYTTLVNRQRRNFRLLREWTNGRPWKVIHQYYDTSGPKNQWLKDGIEDYLSRIAFSINTDEPHLEFSQSLFDQAPFPSSFKNIAKNLLGFRPYNYTDSYPSGIKAEECTLCEHPMEASNTHSGSIVELRCDTTHRFHLSCIFEFWDEEGRLKFDCPICNHSPEFNWKRIGLNGNDPAFMHNLSGWRENFWDNTGRDLTPNQLEERPARFIKGYNVSRFHLGRENARRWAVEAADIRWYKRTFRKRGRDERQGPDTRDPHQPAYRILTQQWRTRNFEQWDRAYDNLPEDGIWRIPASRHGAQEEMSYVRTHRRFRNRALRADFKARKMGLDNLRDGN